MLLNVGAGNDIKDGWVNHDLYKHRDEIDLWFDLNQFPYPDADETYEEVSAWDVLEHLDYPIKVMNEIHRILKKDGIFTAKCCGWQNPNYWVDLTHKHAFDIRSMDYLDPTTELGERYGYYTNRKWKILNKRYDHHKNLIIKMQKI